MGSKKETAIEFLKLFGAGEARKAFELYAAPNFRHHNPYFKGDKLSLIEGVEQSHRQFPHKILDFQRALEEGDLVAVHLRVRMEADSADYALIHILRFEGDKIAELWEAGQMVPEDLVNENGVF